MEKQMDREKIGDLFCLLTQTGGEEVVGHLALLERAQRWISQTVKPKSFTPNDMARLEYFCALLFAKAWSETRHGETTAIRVGDLSVQKKETKGRTWGQLVEEEYANCADLFGDSNFFFAQVAG